MQEIERRWILSFELLENIKSFLSPQTIGIKDIVQTYLGNSHLRVRKIRDKSTEALSYTMTAKRYVGGRGRVREESEIEIDKLMYETVLHLNIKATYVEKKLIELKDKMWISVYTNMDNADLCILEKEFDTLEEADKYELPKEWGKLLEVTQMPRFNAYGLSSPGMNGSVDMGKLFTDGGGL